MKISEFVDKMEYVVGIIRFPRLTVDAIVRPVVLVLRHLHDHFIPTHRNNYHPHILGHRALALFSALLVSVKIFALVALSVGPILPAFSSAITPDNIFSLTNQSRLSYGLKALSYNNVLQQAAQAKADDMLAKGYFSHNTPDGKTPWDFIQAVKYNYIMAGENLAVNFTEAENVEDAWMNSPGHKANILNRSFEEIGIGISQGQYLGHNAIFVVQMFGTPMEQKVALQDSPTKVQIQSVPEPQPVIISSTPQTPVTISNPVAIKPASVPGAGAAPQPAAMGIRSADVDVVKDQVQITAQLSGTPVKVIAYFGRQAVMLDPKTNGSWQANIPISDLAGGKQTVNIKASDLAGKSVEMKLADFSGSTIENYNVLGAQAESKVSFLGKVFNPKVFEQKFYLIFIALILTSLILAIAIHRHIQHLPLIANTAFVVILAVLLWVG